MRIMDYETNRSLNDVGVFLTADEAQELAEYLTCLNGRQGVQRVFLSEFVGHRLEREITVALAEPIAC